MCVVVLLAGCGGSDSGDEVVSAFYPLAYAAEEIGADDVVNLTPPGAEPHDLELSARDVGRIRDASLVVYLGGGFQPALEDAVERRDGPTLDVLQAQGVRLKSDTEGLGDPHVWLDPVRYSAIARAIANALGDPAAGADLVRRLGSLDAELRRGLAHCSRREIVTSHAAFGYLADRYGLHQIALTGVSPEGEPSPQKLEELVDEVRRTRATTVFFETLVPRGPAETVAREAGASTAVLDPLEGLSADDLDAGKDYFDVMRANLAALREALGCR